CRRRLRDYRQGPRSDTGPRPRRRSPQSRRRPREAAGDDRLVLDLTTNTMSKRTSPLMRRLMIALIGVIVVPVLVGGFGVGKFIWNDFLHKRVVKEAQTLIEHNGPQEWAAIARECQTYWDAARAGETAGAPQPALPPALANLRPAYWDVHEDRLYLSWTDGFDDEVLALDYRTAEGKRTLWLISP